MWDTDEKDERITDLFCFSLMLSINRCSSGKHERLWRAQVTRYKPCRDDDERIKTHFRRCCSAWLCLLESHVWLWRSLYTPHPHHIKTCIFKLILALKLASHWTVALPNTPLLNLSLEKNSLQLAVVSLSAVVTSRGSEWETCPLVTPNEPAASCQRKPGLPRL